MCAVAILLVLSLGWEASAWTSPVVGVWYRGDATGAPRLNDLAVIRASGFDTVFWPAGQGEPPAALPSMAASLDLRLEVRPAPRHLTIAAARAPAPHVDIDVAGDLRLVAPLVWRAVARGARSIAFDPGTRHGAGLSAADGAQARWVPAAVAIARQLTANATLVDLMRLAPALPIADPASDGLDVVLLDGGRAWVIVATNVAAAPVTATVTFPKGVPSGLWASWLDESAMSMLYVPSGPRWTLELEPFGTRVYFIDKVQKPPEGHIKM